MKKVKIQAVEGRVPHFPESGRPIPHDKAFDVPDTPQIRRMLREGDIKKLAAPKRAKKKLQQEVRNNDSSC